MPCHLFQWCLFRKSVSCSISDNLQSRGTLYVARGTVTVDWLVDHVILLTLLRSYDLLPHWLLVYMNHSSHTSVHSYHHQSHTSQSAIVTYLINQATNQPIKHSAICWFINQTSTKVCYCASPHQSYIRQSTPVPHLIHHTLGNVVLELILRVDVSDRRHFKCVVSEINCIFVLQLTVRT